MNVGVVLAGGIGSRFGGEVPKQYLKIGNLEVISFAINALLSSNEIDKVVVVCNESYMQDVAKKYCVDVCIGGDNRNTTVSNALDYIKANYQCDNVVFVDSARPMLNDTMLTGALNLLNDFDGVITCQKITDSLGKVGDGMINRDDYYLIQTPEAFKMSTLINFDKNSHHTAIAQQIDFDKVGYNFIDDFNLKITYPNDLIIAEKLLRGENL